MIPPARCGGRKRSINIREVLNAIFYLIWTRCQWKALPKDLPPKSAAHYYFMLWDWDGTLERIHHALYVAVREQAGRAASPTVAMPLWLSPHHEDAVHCRLDGELQTSGADLAA